MMAMTTNAFNADRYFLSNINQQPLRFVYLIAGAAGDRGPRGPPGPPGSPGQNAADSGTGSAVYTRWGRDECPSSATLVYAGK